MKLRLRNLMVPLAATSVLVLPACSSGSSDSHKHFSTVYLANGRAYTRCHDDSTNAFIWYWLILNNGNQPVSVSGSAVSKSDFSGASWRSTTSVPPAVSLTKTNQVVQDDESGQPSSNPDELETESDAATQGNVVDESTTEQEVDSNNGSDNGGSDNGGSDNGGDSGGGDSGGGDAGGGDAGGGD